MFVREQEQLWQQLILKCLMLLNSCANSAVEAETHFKSVKMLNYMTTHGSARRFQLPSLLPCPAQSDDRNHVPGFPSALRFSSTHSCNIHSKRHIQSPTMVCNIPPWEQSIWGRGIYIRQWVLLARPARFRLVGSSTTVFSSNALGSAMSHSIKVVNTELFSKGAS